MSARISRCGCGVKRSAFEERRSREGNLSDSRKTVEQAGVLAVFENRSELGFLRARAMATSMYVVRSIYLFYIYYISKRSASIPDNPKTRARAKFEGAPP